MAEQVVKRERPATGTKTCHEVKVKVCTGCHCVIDDGGLCSFECDLDGEHGNPATYFFAVYQRTDEFLRDEPGSQPRTV